VRNKANLQGGQMNANRLSEKGSWETVRLMRLRKQSQFPCPRLLRRYAPGNDKGLATPSAPRTETIRNKANWRGLAAGNWGPAVQNKANFQVRGRPVVQNKANFREDGMSELKSEHQLCGGGLKRRISRCRASVPARQQLSCEACSAKCYAGSRSRDARPTVPRDVVAQR
jgi:hypothetical protein